LGGYERATTELLQDLLRPGCTFVDLGANIGYFTVLAASLVHPGGRVWCFEPNPRTYERLEANVRGSRAASLVTSSRCALSDANGQADLHLFGDDDALGSLVAQTGDVVRVDLCAGDSILGRERVDAMKIDVEGAELSALRGLDQTIVRNPELRLVIEWNRLYRTRALWDHLAERFRMQRILECPGGYDLLDLRSYDEARLLPLVNLLGSPKG
jgi:FkbM family methyltransferase